MTGPDDPITLKDAAQHFGFTVAALKAEAGRGRLPIYKIGKRLYALPAEVLALPKPRPMPLDKPLRELLFAPSGIYVVGFASFVKIGWSGCIEKRIEEVQQGVPETLTLYRCLEGDIRDERNLHHRFRAHRTRGEWFRLEGELAEWIERGCAA